jgi:hypothetical protein
MNQPTNQLTNVETEAQCQALAERAFQQVWMARNKNSRGHFTGGALATQRMLANVANRIIALRVREVTP